MTEGEQKLVEIATRSAAEATAKVASDSMSQNAVLQERILGEIKILTTTCARMELSLLRGGERMGKLEAGNVECEKHAILTDGKLKSLEKDVSGLEDNRKWFVTIIVGGFLLELWRFISSFKGN